MKDKITALFPCKKQLIAAGAVLAVLAALGAILLSRVLGKHQTDGSN